MKVSFHSCKPKNMFALKYKKGYSKARDHSLHKPEDLVCLKVTVRSMTYKETSSLLDNHGFCSKYKDIMQQAVVLP